MNWFEKILCFLQGEMEDPVPYGWFHWLWIFLVIGSLIFLYLKKNKYNDKQLKIVLGIYGIIAFILELAKQLIWAFNYDAITGIVTWEYEWYAAPFQLCTTPIYISIICLFLKKNKFRDALLSYLAYYTILGSLMTIIIPDSCFTSDILVNIHTMFLHCGSFVVSVYLLFTKEVEVKYSNVIKGLYAFLTFVFIANTLNIVIYNLGILNGESFNMFYISPYFISSLPVYNTVQESIPYFFYLMFYIITIYLGSNIIYFISLGMHSIKKKK
ncbi:MAG: hypothetical protein E7161_00985 [Firmicutes bacterium]|nr:hypothetical protein [Bacillota bacterium]